jgi:hypothetical protein
MAKTHPARSARTKNASNKRAAAVARLILRANRLLAGLEGDRDLFHAVGGAHIDMAAAQARKILRRQA